MKFKIESPRFSEIGSGASESSIEAKPHQGLFPSFPRKAVVPPSAPFQKRFQSSPGKSKFLAGVALLGSLLTSQSVMAETPPNVVIIYADDFGYADLSRNAPAGSLAHTPNIDRICNQGIYLSNYLTHHVCSPSRAGLLTGRHYTRVGSGLETGGTLDNSIPNMAKDFKAAGYATAAFGKWHNSFVPMSDNGKSVHVASRSDVIPDNDIYEDFKNIEWGEGVNSYGFDEWAGFYSGGSDYFNRYGSWAGENDWWINETFSPHVTGYTTDLIGNNAVNFIEDNATSPFLLYVPMLAVHTPFDIKRSDLQEMCDIVDDANPSLAWNAIKLLMSPSSGAVLENVAELRCSPGEEFDMGVLNSTLPGFSELVYCTLAYSMDKQIGAILAKLATHQLTDNTIVVFCSDNGATPNGDNTPFKGSKHTLWEGGIHVAAAIWWPSVMDANQAPYSPGDNEFPHLTQYIDWYPTLMALTEQPLNGTELDGLNLSQNLLNRTSARTGFDHCYYGFDSDWATVRNDRWKLHFNRLPGNQKLEVYDLQVDISESSNVQESNATERDIMIGLIDDWFKTGIVSASYMPIHPDQIAYEKPAADGDVFEVKATQTADIGNPDFDSLFVQLFEIDSKAYESYIHAGDQYEYDIYVAEDSDQISGICASLERHSRATFDSNNGLNPQGGLVALQALPKGQWVRQIVGIGERAALPAQHHLVALRSGSAGYYHFYLDNVLVRKADGTIRAVVWNQEADTRSPIIYRYKGGIYHHWQDLVAIPGFPYSTITHSTVDIDSIATPPPSPSGVQTYTLTPADGIGIDYPVWATSTSASSGTGLNTITANLQTGDFTGAGQVRRGVLAFDIDDTVASGTLISAKLRLNHRGGNLTADALGGPVSLYHAEAATAWSASTAEELKGWFNLAWWNDTAKDVVTNPSEADGYKEIDVSDQVLEDLTNDPGRPAIDGGFNKVMSHFLIRWDHEGATGGLVSFDSVDNVTGEPVLEIMVDYGPPSSESSGSNFNSWADGVGGLLRMDPNEVGPINRWPLIMEYAFGSNPNAVTDGLLQDSSVPTSQQFGTYQYQNLLVSGVNDDYLTLSFDFNRDANDIEIVLEESINLRDWSERLVLKPPYSDMNVLATHPAVLSVSDNSDGGYSANTVRITARSTESMADAPRTFIKLGVRATVAAASSPLNLGASPHEGILLEWNGTAENGEYVIERALGESSSFLEVGRTRNRQFTDTTALSGQSYKYRVLSRNAAGFSMWSNTVVVTR